MADNRKAAVKKLKKLVIDPREEVEDYRSRFEETLSEVFLPHHVERVEHAYGTIKSDVLIPELSSVGKVILYIHGGSFAAGSRISYRTFCA
ncbi:MAG: alpha/beta hydrolase, partial [Treponema sp.]|nr:alpha/beta hydrolase [Treponema sp.]